MRTPLHGLQPPYTLPSNVVYFHDWRYVSPGSYAWLGPDDEYVPMMAPGPVPQMHYEYRGMPLGISLQAQPATKTQVVLSARRHGYAGVFGGSLIHEDGVYRLWYESWLKEDFQSGRVGTFNALCYAQSTDGMHWDLPNVGNAKYKHSRHNVVYGASITPRSGFHGGCVFKDPSAPKSQRYKAFHLGRVDRKTYQDYAQEHPHDIDPMVTRTIQQGDYCWGLYGATSPDGIQWKAIRKPLLLQNSDTHNICEYDEHLGQYVAYVRTWYFQRRTIGRTASGDYRHFPLPEEVFWPDAMQQPYDTWYVNGKTAMPGAPDYHLMFPMRWGLPDDSFEFHLASSPDNVVWSFVPGEAVCRPGEVGQWDGGVVVPGLGMVPLPGDRVGIIYAGTPVPHKYPRRPPFGALAWATWPTGRLVALQCPLEGGFSLHPLLFGGRTVHLNYRTKKTGYIRVQADADSQPLPGRSFDDCDPLCGNELDQTITWQGETDLGHKDGQAVSLHFELRNADLFSVRFQ